MANGQTVRLAGEAQRQLAHRLIDRAPPFAVVNIQEAKRSLDQNSKWHAMVSDIARAKPDGRVHDVATWKCLLMAEANFTPKFQPSLDGQSVICTGFKSSGLRKSEFADLITATYAFGDSKGIRWSEPVDNPSH